MAPWLLPRIPLPHSTLDVLDGRGQPRLFTGAQMVSFLAQKGFCLVGADIHPDIWDQAMSEAHDLKEQGVFERPPWQVLSGLLGEQGSAWRCQLEAPEQSSTPEAEEALRTVEQYLVDVGLSLAGTSQSKLGMHLKRRSKTGLYFSRTPEDDDNPSLTDLEVAKRYAAKIATKKVQCVFYGGPGLATLEIVPVTNDKYLKPFRTYIRPNTIVLLVGGVCRCSIEPSESIRGLSVEIDLYVPDKPGQPGWDPNGVPCTPELLSWMEEQLQAFLGKGTLKNVPPTWEKRARQLFLHSHQHPLRIVQLASDLPGRALQSGIAAPFDGAALLGLDCIVEVPHSKWDIDAYYHEDPSKADEFKMYTRHMGTIEYSNFFGSESSFSMFGITKDEEPIIDRRFVRLSHSTFTCLQAADVQKEALLHKSIGIFSGISSAGSFNQFMCPAYQISKAACANMSAAALVSRMSYRLGTRGPCIAVDTEDSSGSSAINEACMHTRQGACNPFALVGSVHLIHNPFVMVMACASGLLSAGSAARVFDESCNGLVAAEAVVTGLIEAHTHHPPTRQYYGLIVGTAINSKGQSSSFTSPSGPALVDVQCMALQDAAIPAATLDATEVHAGGTMLNDAMELGAVRKIVADQANQRSTVALRAGKAQQGSAGASSGLVSIVRCCLLFQHALHGPCIHLRELCEIGEEVLLDFEERGYLRIPTECFKAQGCMQMVSVNCFGASGTNVNHVLWGYPFQGHPEAGAQMQQPIHWFPGMPSTANNEEPEEGYFVVGSWNAFSTGIKMVEVGRSSFECSVTLGENLYEHFQIWQDNDPSKVLCPPSASAGQGSQVLGPDACDTTHAWLLDGRSSKTRLVNTEQWEAFQKKTQKAAMGGLALPVRTQPAVCTYAAGYQPAGNENAIGEDGMPTIDTNEELAGRPGDRYAIRLSLSHTFRTVTWRKLEYAAAEEKDDSVELAEYPHLYHTMGDHNLWKATPLTPNTEDKGLHSAEIQILKERSSFIIVRDRDMRQGFYPSSSGTSVEGPGQPVLGNKWWISGRAGDIFKVMFRRNVDDKGIDTKAITWKFVRPGTVKVSDTASTSTMYSIYGSGSPLPMVPDEDDPSCLVQEVTVGASGREAFNIRLNSNPMTTVAPKDPEPFGNVNRPWVLMHGVTVTEGPSTSSRDLSLLEEGEVVTVLEVMALPQERRVRARIQEPAGWISVMDTVDGFRWAEKTYRASFRDDNHTLDGPLDGSRFNCWEIGQHPDDGVKPGDCVRICLKLEGGLPQSVSWMKLTVNAYNE